MLMETSLHRQLKRAYAGPAGRLEVRVGSFRIDAVVDGPDGLELVEIQHGPLWAIRDKIRRLTAEHRVRLVKPIIGRKRLVKLGRTGDKVLERRTSPRQGRLLELFDELVFFTQAFPHANLVIEGLLVEVEELRRPSTRRRRRRHVVEDQRLLKIHQTVQISGAADLARLVPCRLPTPFHTGHLAAGLEVERWEAQRIAYVLRRAGAVETAGKQRGAWLYRWTEQAAKRQAA
jgi:hypothetical protein